MNKRKILLVILLIILVILGMVELMFAPIIVSAIIYPLTEISFEDRFLYPIGAVILMPILLLALSPYAALLLLIEHIYKEIKSA